MKKEKSFKNDLEWIKDQVKMDIGINVMMPKTHKKNHYWVVASSILNNIYFVIQMRICEKFGHKLEDEGYATPDSGAIIMVCTRCGWSHKTILY